MQPAVRSLQVVNLCHGVSGQRHICDCCRHTIWRDSYQLVSLVSGKLVLRTEVFGYLYACPECNSTRESRQRGIMKFRLNRRFLRKRPSTSLTYGSEMHIECAILETQISKVFIEGFSWQEGYLGLGDKTCTLDALYDQSINSVFHLPLTLSCVRLWITRGVLEKGLNCATFCPFAKLS